MEQKRKMKTENKQKYIALSLAFACLVVIFALLFVLLGCRTIEYVNPKLPEYKLEEIERPQIKEQTAEVVLLMRYAEKKEIQLKNFYNFYEALRESQK